MEETMTTNSNLEEFKQDLIANIDQRVSDKIIEQANADLLKKLIRNAENATEAISIAALGTTYKRTGFHFDKRLEKISNDIKFKSKNDKLSFVCDPDRPTHQLIIGDNYDALQNLIITHKNKIDVIYIDPPYGKDNMGEFAQTNYDNAITRDNLLSMLYPRLQLAKRLLTPEGVIFCSIDDKNQAYVKCLFDEVFGEENTEQYIWCLQDKTEGSFVKTAGYRVRKEHEFIIAAFLSKEKRFNRYKENLNFINGGFSNPDNDPRGEWFSGNISRNGIKSTSGSKYYTITNPAGEKFTRNWTLSKEEYLAALKDNRIWFGSKGDGVPRLKIFKSATREVIQSSLFTDVHTSITGKNELKNIFARESPFAFPKPSSLIKRLIELSEETKDSVILDFFAGSGTTGQAVMELNREDGGSRTFILCTNNEVTETNPNGIAYDVTSKRLKRVMSGECYDGTNDFPWLRDHKPYMDNLNVYEIDKVSKTETSFGETAFDKIDETCYGLPRFECATGKIEWVCQNFENATKFLEK